jgi:hypothetical protein
MNWLEKLKIRWQVNSIWQVLVILLVFACTGFSILYLKRFLNGLVGIDENTAGWIKLVFWLLVILPLYQVVLLFYGFVFGQFKFFWNFEKRMVKGIGSLFSRRTRDK